MDKRNIFEQIKAELEETLANNEKSKQEYQEEANRHKGRMASRYDTFKEEAQMMVSAQEVRIAELRASLVQIQAVLDHPTALNAVDTIRSSTVILLEADDGTKRRHVLAPTGGGIKVIVGDEELVVITPDSPLGKQLMGLTVGDEVEIKVGNNKRSYEVMEVE